MTDEQRKAVADFYWSCCIGDRCSSVDCKVYVGGQND